MVSKDKLFLLTSKGGEGPKNTLVKGLQVGNMTESLTLNMLTS